MHLKPHQLPPSTLKKFHIKGVQRRSPRPGIDLDLEHIDAQLGQPDPFAPADNGPRRFVLSPGGHDLEI
jgi:hypothetical protein